MQKIRWSNLIISVMLAEFIGILASLFAGNTGEIYKNLSMPPLAPPGWLFPLVWIILYACMGIAAYLIFDSPGAGEVQKRKALTLYGAQLFINFLWPIVFFRFEMFGAAIIVIILLDILVLLTMIKFYKISRLTVWLLLPYLLWILFATYLNIGIYLLN